MHTGTLATALEARYPGQIIEVDGPRHFILTGPTASRTLTFEVGDDTVRIFVSRLVHGEVYDDDDDVDEIIAVVDAIVSGGATELYGSTAGGVVGFIGYQIRGDRVAITGLDDAATIVHRATV